MIKLSETEFTHREYNCLLALRRKPMRHKDLKPLSGLSENDISITLSRLSALYYVEDSATAWDGVLHLNDIGKTVAQAEFDRRFDMYLTRTASIAALIISAIALIA